MKAIVCLILLLAAGTALSEEFSAENATREKACSDAVLKAKTKGFAIGKSECFCDFVAARNTTSCTVDSTGDKHFKSSPSSTSANVSGTEFSVTDLSRDVACNAVIIEARKAGYEISKFDCDCNPGVIPKLTTCKVDSAGQKRIQSAGKPTPPAQASRQPATPGQVAKEPTRPGPAQCAAMAKHKDTKLKADMQRAQKSIDAAKDSLALIAEVREKVTGLHENQKLANNAYKVTLVTKLTNDLIADILKSYPPTSKAMKTAEEAASIAQRVILMTAKAVSYAESPVQYKAKELARQVPVAGDIVVGAFNLGKNIQNLKEASEEGDEIIDVTDEGLKGQQRLIGKLKTRLDTSTFRLEMLKKLGSEIDKVCS